MRRPRSSVAIHVARSTGCSSAASPKATLAGLPPTCSSVWPAGVVTASTSASPMTRVRTGAVGVFTSWASGVDHVRAAEPSRTVEAVLAVDGADGAAARAHDEGVGACRLRSVAHSAEQLAVRDAGRDEEALTHDEVVGGQDAVEVVTGVEGLLALLVVLGPELALDDAAGALDGARGDDALRGAADAEQQVDAGVGTGRHDGTRDVTVDDVADAGTGVADLLGEVVVARTVQHDDGDVGRGLPLGLGDAPDVLGDREPDVDDVGRVGHRAAVGDGHDGDGVVHALGGQRGAVDRVDGDVDLGAGAVTDLLAVEEHRRVVLLTLPDDDDPAHADGRDHRAHGLDGGTVCLVLLAAADPTASGHGCRLGHPDQLESEVAIRLAVLHQGPPSAQNKSAPA